MAPELALSALQDQWDPLGKPMLSTQETSGFHSGNQWDPLRQPVGSTGETSGIHPENKWLPLRKLVGSTQATSEIHSGNQWEPLGKQVGSTQMAQVFLTEARLSTNLRNFGMTVSRRRCHGNSCT